MHDITNNRDKMGPIRKLHALIRANPSLDVSSYLQKVSNVFKKFVLETLQKLDASQDNNASSNSGVSMNVDENIGVAATTVPSKPAEGAEAMRILEGIKSKTSAEPRMSVSSAANWAAMQKVSDSLFTVSELVGPSIDGDLAARLARIKSLSGAPK